MQRLSEISLLVFIGAGMIFCFGMPPFQVPDESAHWLSAVVMADGGSISRPACNKAIELPNHFFTGDVIHRPDVPFPRERFKKWREIKSACSKVPVVYSNFFTYPVVIFLSSLLPKARESGFSAIRLLYLSRLMGGLLIAWMLWRFIRESEGAYGALPTGGMTLIAFVLSPIFLQQSFAVTADTVVNASALALVTVLVGWPDVGRLSLGLLLALGGAAVVSKPVLSPLYVAAAFALMFRSWRGSGSFVQWWKTPKTRWTILVCLVLGSLGIMGFLIFQTRVGVSGHHYEDAAVQPMVQARYVLAHPVAFLKSVGRSHGGYFSARAWTGNLGYLDAEPLPRLTLLWGLLFAVAVLADLGSLMIWVRSRRSLPPGFWAGVTWLAAGAVGTWIAIDLAVYLTGNAPGTPIIYGLQQRYFFPSLFLFLAALSPMTVPGGLWRHGSARLMLQKRGVPFLLIAIGVLFFCELLLALFLTLAGRYW